MRQLRQGLQRFEDTITHQIERFVTKLDEATTIQVALQLFQEGKSTITADDVDEVCFSHANMWFIGSSSSTNRFDWNRLDRIDFRTYFPAC